MKKISYMYLGLALFCSGNNIFGMEPLRLDDNVLAQGAKEFLASLSVEKPVIKLEQAELISFLHDRISIARNIMVGENSLAEQELQRLDARSRWELAKSFIMTNPNARVVYYYARMVEINCGSMLLLKKALGEKYGNKRLITSVDEFNTMRLQSSHDFAKAVLKQISLQSK